MLEQRVDGYFAERPFAVAMMQCFKLATCNVSRVTKLPTTAESQKTTSADRGMSIPSRKILLVGRNRSTVCGNNVKQVSAQLDVLQFGDMRNASYGFLRRYE